MIVGSLLLINPSILLAVLLAGTFGGIAGAYGYEVLLWTRSFALQFLARMQHLKITITPLRNKFANSMYAIIGFAGLAFFILSMGMAVVEFDAPYWVGSLVGLLGGLWIGGLAFMGSGVWDLVPGPFELVETLNESDGIFIVIEKCSKDTVLDNEFSEISKEVVCC